MNRLWAFLLTIVLLIVGVGACIAFEMIVHPNSDQRQRFGNVAFAVDLLLILAIWAWHFVSRQR